MNWYLYSAGTAKCVADIKTAWLINHINHSYGRKKRRFKK